MWRGGKCQHTINLAFVPKVLGLKAGVCSSCLKTTEVLGWADGPAGKDAQAAKSVS